MKRHERDHRTSNPEWSTERGMMLWAFVISPGRREINDMQAFCRLLTSEGHNGS
jgi:hypothetical protein